VAACGFAWMYFQVKHDDGFANCPMEFERLQNIGRYDGIEEESEDPRGPRTKDTFKAMAGRAGQGPQLKITNHSLVFSESSNFSWQS
jgi:hypothetical protein